MEPPSAAWGALESAETRFVTDIQWPTWLKLSNLDEQGGKSESRRAERTRSPLRPVDLYTIRIISRARSKLSNDTKFDNVSLNANTITQAHDIYLQVYNTGPLHWATTLR